MTYDRFILLGLQKLPHIYEGTVDSRTITGRRAANKVARKSRRANRIARKTANANF